MTERQYLMDIKRKCDALGTWRDEFERTQRRLAKVYARIDSVEEAYTRSGGLAVIMHTNKAGAKNEMRNPFLVELDILYDQALTYEREMGLTAAALKRINEGAMRKNEGGPLAELAKVIGQYEQKPRIIPGGRTADR